MTGDFGAIEGQRVVPLDLAPEELRIELDPAPLPDPSPESQPIWEELIAENPRYFDAPILADAGFDGASSTQRARLERYSHLACGTGSPPVVTLAVTGALLATDGLGAQHVLLARRSHETRIYGGMWEIGPAGGMDPPPTTEHLGSGALLDGRDAWRQLVLEIEEEVSLPISPDPGRIVGLVTDTLARSTDIVFRVPIVRPLEDLMQAQGETNWEYTETRWVAVADIASFDSRYADEVIAPTRAMFRLLGWC
ncbi:MAG: hypothetical protein AAGB51_07980 [Planctomycetota bacterium]